MEIQQQEKESLAAYIHWFKTDTKRCNFTNDGTTIIIFIKGLKNADSLATCIYEKGLQTLTGAISEVERLNAVQKLTAMIIPPSMVNMMSHEEDHCFQCQEQGDIAWNCPNIRCFEHDEYVMDCPHRIPSSGTPANHHQPKPHRSHHTRSSSRHNCEDKARQSQSRSQSNFCRQGSLSHHDSYRGHSRSQNWDTRCHRSSSQCSHSTYRGYSHWSNCDTPHWLHHRSSTQRSSSTYHSRDCSRSCSWPSYKSSSDTHTDQTHIPADHKANHTSRRTWGWKSKIHTWTITTLMNIPVTQERNPIS